MASESKLIALNSRWLLWAACPTSISKWCFCSAAGAVIVTRSHCRSSGLTLLTPQCNRWCDLRKHNTTNKHNHHNCWKGNSSAGAEVLMETRCHLTNVPVHKSSGKKLLQHCNPPQPHITTPGDTSRLNWLLMQGEWLIQHPEKRGTCTRGQGQSWLWHALIVTTRVSSWQTSGDLFAMPKCQHPSWSEGW